MSTITSPRDPSTSTNNRRLPPLSTPTTSSRPSLDSPSNFPPRPSGLRSTSASPNRGPTAPAPAKRNRAALREYYNLQNQSLAQGTKKDEETESYAGSEFGDSEVQESEMDRVEFEAGGFVKRVLGESSLEELLRVYNRVLSDIRALDAEKKALVYDNYSKLISATDTIRRMRANMDPLNPMASTLDPAIAQIYESATVVKQELRESVTSAEGDYDEDAEAERAKVMERRRAEAVAKRVLDTPRQIRELVEEGRDDEARSLWVRVRGVLEWWREEGKGGNDVLSCIEDGDAAMRGEVAGEKIWAGV